MPSDRSRDALGADVIGRLTGSTVITVYPVGGGDICESIVAELSDGRTVFAKARPGMPPDFFATEARGLRRLGAVHGGVPVPEVVAHDHSCLVLEWLETGPPSAPSAERFGRSLATTHRSGGDVFGSPYGDGWIATLPLAGGPWTSWPQMWAEGRVLPYLRAAVDSSAVTLPDARDIERVLADLPRLAGPAEPPALVHGDLWAGNVLWCADGIARLVDPAAHGGHRETDLAMLALFGCPHLDRVLGAYNDSAPLGDGWQARVALHQLHPVLVHAVLFGGSYGAQAGRLARASLRAG
ncbi:MAG TPA: fructosamine kinase family protein [Jiangellaceae bacterium]|nr:fructosamine kinase family protein [Jiangellaceae bacterium]